jgi:hypothetical protein
MRIASPLSGCSGKGSWFQSRSRAKPCKRLLEIVHSIRRRATSTDFAGTVLERIGCWLSNYLGVPDSEYSRAIGLRWLISAVARIFNSGAKSRLLPDPGGTARE